MEVRKNECFPTSNHIEMLKVINSEWRDYIWFIKNCYPFLNFSIINMFYLCYFRKGQIKRKELLLILSLSCFPTWIWLLRNTDSNLKPVTSNISDPMAYSLCTNLISGFILFLNFVFILVPSTHFIFLSFLCLYKCCGFKDHGTSSIVWFREDWVPAPTGYNEGSIYLSESNTIYSSLQPRQFIKLIFISPLKMDLSLQDKFPDINVKYNGSVLIHSKK